MKNSKSSLDKRGCKEKVEIGKLKPSEVLKIVKGEGGGKRSQMKN